MAIRVGVIGASLRNGWGSDAHIPALSALREYEITAICTSRQETADEKAKHFGIPLAFAVPYKMVQHPDVDLVSFCVRVPFHHQLGMAALNAGKHLYCEWPLAATTEQAQQMANELAYGPTLAYGGVKRLLHGAAINLLCEQMELENESPADTARSADAQEGLNAFLAKRPHNSAAARGQSVAPLRHQTQQYDPRFIDGWNTNVHITFVGKPSNRETILTEGLRVVHERGFTGASVRDIVEAAQVPQGSFTNHFVSKEAFCLEILDLYFKGTRAMIHETLRNESLPPPKRLRAFVDAQINYLKRNGWRNGCLIGNFSAEASEHSEVIRKRIVQLFEEMRKSVAYCLKAAVKSGDLSRKNDCDELAGFLIASLQGAILQSKAERTAVPIERFKHLLFSTILQ